MKKLTFEKLDKIFGIEHSPVVEYSIDDYPRSLGGVPPAWRADWSRERLRAFNSKIGKIGGRASYDKKSLKDKKEWHSKGGSTSSCAKQKYKITTPDNETFTLKYEALREECKKRGWSFNTIHWQAYRKGIISRGAAKGVRVEIIN